MIPPLRQFALPATFILLTLLLLAGKDVYLLKGDPFDMVGHYDEIVYFCQDIPACLRIGSAWSWKLIAEFFTSATLFLFTYDLPGLEVNPDNVYIANAIAMSAVVHRILALSPLLYAISVLTAKPSAGLVLLLVVFAAMFGWSEAIYGPAIGFYRLFADWPVYYWDFAMMLRFYDYMSAGFLFLLLARLSRETFPSFAELAALTIAGQLLFENLGIVTGIAAFTATLLAGPAVQMRLALQRLGICAAASATAMAVMLAIIQIRHGAGAGDHSETIGGYLASYSDLVANNFRALPIIIANFISLLTLPVIFGSLAGLLIQRIEGVGRTTAGRSAAAATGIVAGFAVTLLIGFFVNSYLSETGRQTWPFVVMVTVASALATRWLATRRADIKAAR